MAATPLRSWFAQYGSWGLLGPALLIGLGRGFIIPVLPVMARDEFGIGAAAATFIFAAIAIGNLVFTIPTGYLVDLIGRRKVLITAPLLITLSSILIFFAEHYWQIVFYLVLTGCALQMWMLGRLATISDSKETQNRGRMITGISGMQRIGFLLGPFIGGLVGAYLGLRFPFLLFASMGLISALVMYTMVPESSPTLLRRKAQQADESEASDDIDSKAEKEENEEPKPRLLELLTPTAIVVFVAQFFSNIARSGMAGQTGPALIFGAYVFGLGSAELGTIAFLVGVVTVPVTFLNGQIIDRYGRKSAFVPASKVLAAALLTFSLIAILSWPLWTFIAAFAIGNIALAFMAGTLQTITSDIAPTYHRGRFIALSRITVSSGTLATPLIYASALALLATPGGYVVGFGLMGCAALASSLIISRNKAIR